MSALQFPRPAALLLIDLQQAIDHPKWTVDGARNNPHAELAASRLLGNWREISWPIFHIRHDSTEPQSPYRPGQPGHAFKAETMPIASETVIGKRTNSAFIDTDLEQKLRDADLDHLVICGVITNNSVEASVRMAGNLGFRVDLAADACFTFGKRDLNGRLWSADDIHALSLANLQGEYANITASAEILAALGR